MPLFPSPFFTRFTGKMIISVFKPNYFIVVLSLTAVAAVTSSSVSTWSCIPNPFTNTSQHNGTLVPDGSVVYKDMNCTGQVEGSTVGPIRVHIVSIDLTAVDPVRHRRRARSVEGEGRSAPTTKLFISPIIANTTDGLSTLTQMMAADGRKLLVAINGGYFFRLDDKRFFDDVCFGKSREEAEQPPTPSHPNRGIGDCATVIDGVLKSSTCDPIYGYNRPTALIVNGTLSYVQLQTKGATPPLGAENVITAGPNLVSTFYNEDNDTRTTEVHIPKDDENLNILGTNANTAVGLTNKRNVNQSGPLTTFDTMYMVTFDGRDGCLFDPTCGVSARPLAYFMKDYLHVEQAMNMDQGGSTTMVVRTESTALGPDSPFGPYGNGLVTCTDYPHCGPGQRNIFNGLAVGIEN